MYLYKTNVMYLKFQIVSLIPLLSTIFWMYKLSNTAQVTAILTTKIGRIITIISTLTLEIYMVQYAIFTDAYNKIFPLNLILTFAVCVSLAYVVRCLSNVFTQVFSDVPFDWSKVYKI